MAKTFIVNIFGDNLSVVQDDDGRFVIPNTMRGLGGAMKPAHEPIMVARKPLSESTIAENLLHWGTGGLNIDACRVAASQGDRFGGGGLNSPVNGFMGNSDQTYEKGMGFRDDTQLGRWPANLILSHSPSCQCIGTKKVKGITGGRMRKPGYGLTQMLKGENPTIPGDPGYADSDGLEEVEDWICAPGCPVALMDAQSGERPSGGGNKNKCNRNNGKTMGDGLGLGNGNGVGGDSGGASRFFQHCNYSEEDWEPFRYVAKASRRERDEGLDALPMIEGKRTQAGGDDTRGRPIPCNHNTNPCVKPISLMRYLCRLITPLGGIILDPFAGSGSTGCAAIMEGFNFIGIEQDPEYVEIARARITHWEKKAKDPPKEKPKRKKPDPIQRQQALF